MEVSVVTRYIRADEKYVAIIYTLDYYGDNITDRDLELIAEWVENKYGNSEE